MNSKNRFCIKLIHCGNKNIVNPVDTEEKNIFLLPMGMLPLADALKQSGAHVEIIHSDLETGRRIEDLLDFNTLDAVGFDCHWINQSRAVLDTAEMIKKMKPGVFIFLGGFSASLFAEEIVSAYWQVDAIIRGDAEVPIVELYRALRRQIPFREVRNLVWKDREGHLKVNEFTYTGTAQDMDKLDFAAFHLLRNFEYYKVASKFWTKFTPISTSPIFLLEVGRGCQYACTFCGGNCVAQYRINKRKKTVFRSIDAVIATMKKAVSYGFETFYTCLESEGSHQWYLELFNRVHEEKLEVNFVYGSWGLPPGDLIEALSRNFAHSLIEISPETANMELRRINKDIRLFYTNEQLEKVLNHAKEKENVKIQLYFGFYLTGDTKKTIWETLNYILKLLLQYPRLLEIEYSNFSTDPGSLFFFYPEKYRLVIKVRKFSDYIRCIKESYEGKKGESADLTLFRPVNISKDEDIEIRRKIRLLHHLFSFYGKSAAYILRETGSPETVLSFLEKAKISTGADCTFPANEIKEMLLDHCRRSKIANEALIRIIRTESDQYNSYRQQNRATPTLRLVDEKEEDPRQDRPLVSNFKLLDANTEEKKLQDMEFDI
jgi:radical SAM superfamily enzyme YgiQ (UPF0313 family)